MASLGTRALRLTIVGLLCDCGELLKCCFLLLYCRLYKFVNSCFVVQTLYACYYGTLSFMFGDRQKMEWKTHWQSPVCRAILRQKYFSTRSKNSSTWALSHFALALLLFIELKVTFIASFFGNYSNAIWFVTSFLCFLSSVNAIVALTLCIWSAFSKPMPISPVQKRLFRISDNDSGFELKVPVSNSDVAKPERPQFTSWRESFEGSGHTSYLSLTPINNSYNSWGSSSGGSPTLDTASSSWSYYGGRSPVNYSSTPKSNADRSAMCKFNYSDSIECPYDKPITNQKHLDEFLKAQEVETRNMPLSFEEEKQIMATIDTTRMSILSKDVYQRGYRLPYSEMTEDDSSDMYLGDNILNKLKITDKMLAIGYERIRKWICQTILVKLVQEIDDINLTLAEIGLPEFQVGNISLFALHQIAATKSQHLPTLLSVLPYLDLHANQEYLVKRLKDLARGGCMGEFKWNSGGSYNDKQWCDDLPNDSSILMFILCRYMDAHLPPDPHFPEGKPFSSRYFKKPPDKLVMSKNLTCIYQSSLNPPHFKVVLNEDLYSLQRGRNNLFCALVLFLHHMKTEECGMLGRVNLGPSGLNMLWVVD